MRLKIAIASDHAGFEYKQMISRFLEDLGHIVVDFGTKSVESCDYPDFIGPAVRSLSTGIVDRCIVLGGSGNGEAIVANRFGGVRCALCWSKETAVWGRSHNNANCLAIGARTIDERLCLQIVDLWLNTEFEGGRHIRRIEKIEESC